MSVCLSFIWLSRLSFFGSYQLMWTCYTFTEDSHNTGNFMPYCFRIVCGFFNVPRNCEHSRVVRLSLRFIVLIREPQNETTERKRSKRPKQITKTSLFWWFRLFWPSRFVRFPGFRDFVLVVSVASLVSFRWFRFVDLVLVHAPILVILL